METKNVLVVLAGALVLSLIVSLAVVGGFKGTGYAVGDTVKVRVAEGKSGTFSLGGVKHTITVSKTFRYQQYPSANVIVDGDTTYGIQVGGSISTPSNLKVTVDKITSFFRRDYEKLETVRFKKKISSRYLTSETKKVVMFLLIFLFVIFFGYFVYQLTLFLSPPKISLIEPKTTVFRKEEKIKIVGQTEKDASVTIFGERVFQNKDGRFEYQFPLHEGNNELMIEVIGANGKKTTLKKIFKLLD